MRNLTSTACLLSICLLTTACAATQIHVAPDGQAGAAGTADAPLADLAEAAERANPGDVIRIKGGTYHVAETIKLTHSGAPDNPIRIEPADDIRPVFDFSQQETHHLARGIEVNGDYWHIIGIEVMGAGDNGFYISGSHNVIERCVAHHNRDTGFDVHQPGSHNLITHCDSYRNFDAHTNGENADGFSAKHDVGPGIVFRFCRAWENADDGWDLWKATNSVRIEDSIAFRNGVNLDHLPEYEGDGNGFKLGGDHLPGPHVVVRCVAIDHWFRGFNQNNNTAALTIEDSTAINCNVGFHFPRAPETGNHILRHNISYNCETNNIAEGTVQEGNQWITELATPGR